MAEINDYEVSTPVCVPNLLELIKGYSDYDFISNGFTNGFKLGLKSNPHLVASKREKRSRNPKILSDKLQAEVSHGRIIGPFKTQPIRGMMVSPMYCIPKPGSNKWRMIFDLSSPHGSSVNDNIPDSHRSVSYCDIKSVVKHILSTENNSAYFAKLDLSDAYRMVPMAKSEWKYLGMKVGDNYYVDCRLPMGASSSCQVFQRISDMLCWLFTSIQDDQCKIFNYLDDFLVVARDGDSCNRVLDRILAICDHVGVPVAPHKTERASESIVFLGIGICSNSQSLFIPSQKSESVLESIDSFLKRRNPQVKQWQSLLGKLCHLSQVVVAGRAYLSSLYGSLKGILSSEQHLHRRISPEMHKDLLVWRDFLQDSGKGKRFSYIVGGDAEHTIVSDASTTIGYGAYMWKEWFDGVWPDNFWRSLNIAVLELYPIFVALSYWQDILRNSTVKICTDSNALVPVINKLYCRDPEIRRLLRPIALICMTHNILLVASHVKGIENIGADLLSRNGRDKFIREFSEMAPQPVEIPAALRPMAVRARYW